MLLNFRRLSVFLIGLLAVVPTAPLPASAATLTVTDFGDTGAPGQLRTLINAAAGGDTIIIPAGTIRLITLAEEDANATGDLDIHKDLTIQGAAAGSTIIDGDGRSDRVFDIFAPATVTISNVTIRNAFPLGGIGGGGGGIRNAGTLTLTNVTVSGNRAFGFPQVAGGTVDVTGGGILNTSTMTLTNVTVSARTDISTKVNFRRIPTERTAAAVKKWIRRFLCERTAKMIPRVATLQLVKTPRTTSPVLLILFGFILFLR